MKYLVVALVVALVAAAACHGGQPRPTSAGRVAIDRFSAAAGHLMVRTVENDLPGPDQPIDLDAPPFITQGLGPDGAIVRYYNFDIQPITPAARFRLTHAGAHAALPNELDLVDAIPGQPGYSDFWQIHWVEVPDGFVAGSITRVAQIRQRNLTVTDDPRILDCPIVPNGTIAHVGDGVGSVARTTLRYRGTQLTCLQFGDPLVIDAGKVPTSAIYVTTATEPGTSQTHNVVFSVPGDSDYSPLWALHIYDRAAFASVHDAGTASDAPLIEPHGPLVNCPIVFRDHKN